MERNIFREIEEIEHKVDRLRLTLAELDKKLDAILAALTPPNTLVLTLGKPIPQ